MSQQMVRGQFDYLENCQPSDDNSLLTRPLRVAGSLLVTINKSTGFDADLSGGTRGVPRRNAQTRESHPADAHVFIGRAGR